MAIKQLGPVPFDPMDAANRAYADSNLKSVATQESETLTTNQDYLSLKTLEVGASYSLEIPATSSLEIYDYSPPPAAWQQAFVATQQPLGGSAWTTFTDSGIGTDAVAVTVGLSGAVQVSISVDISIATGNTSAAVSLALTGANSITAATNFTSGYGFNFYAGSVPSVGFVASLSVTSGKTFIVTGLTPGTTIFSLQYNAGSCYFSNRNILVTPL